jgi:hypothetical protein
MNTFINTHPLSYLACNGCATHGLAAPRRELCRPRPLLAGTAVTIVAMLAAGAAQAGLLIPNGNPTGAPSAWDPTSTLSVQLTPNPAIFEPQGNCPWLLPALKVATQPYINANNIWNYTFATLQGSLTLNSYSAWVNNDPAITIGSGASAITAPASAAAGYGGANFGISYNPVGTDPTTGIHWVQVIDLNQPGNTPGTPPRGNAYGVSTGGGFTAYMDNSGNATTGASANNPYYGNLSGFAYANGVGILDAPARPLDAADNGLDWEAQAFLTTESDTVSGAVTTHNVKVYDGVWWGFQIVPEPSTMALAGLGGLVAMLVARRQRK